MEDQIGEDLRLTLLLAAQAAQRMVQMFDERSRDSAREGQDAARRFQAEMQAHHPPAPGSPDTDPAVLSNRNIVPAPVRSAFVFAGG